MDTYRPRAAHCLAVAVGCVIVSTQEVQAQGVIEACYVEKTGLIYRIDPTGSLPGDLPATCAKEDKHFEFDWNQQGPQGEQGPPGPGTVFTAHVNSFGLGSGTGVASAGRLGPGKFFIVFDEDIALCHRVAGLGHPTEVRLNENLFEGIPGEISTFASLTGNNRLIVVTRDSAGNLDDKDFHVVVACDP